MIEMSISMLSDFTPIILILGGVAASAWLLAILLKSAPIVGNPMSKILKAISIFGFFVGILLLITGASIWSTEVWDTATKYLLIITGLSLFLKPLRQIPWAALVGLIIGSVCVFLVYFYFPLPEIIFNISSTWFYLAIFFIPALATYLFFKFLEDLMKLIGLILASKPVATILGIICISHGILLLFNQNLFSILGI
jgi:hypothetical protein